MAWRLAKSLTTLRTQVNTAYPDRSKISDGTIGDPAHASRASDHNPNAAGVVCALDLTHDPANGFDAHLLADTLIKNRHSNLKYVISNARIAGAWTGWKWTPYSGSNLHTRHIHVSVGVGTDGKSQPPYDSTTPWVIKGDDMINNQDEANLLYKAVLHRNGESAAALTGRVGQDWGLAITDMMGGVERKNIDTKLANADKLQAQVTDLTVGNAVLTKAVEVKDTEIRRLESEVESLKAQVGDNSKWETFKALIKELIS